jgi:hypothetical protein
LGAHEAEPARIRVESCDDWPSKSSLLGKKIGMTRIFNEAGVSSP